MCNPQFYFIGKSSKCIYLIKWDLRMLGKILNISCNIVRNLYLSCRVFKMANLVVRARFLSEAFLKYPSIICHEISQKVIFLSGPLYFFKCTKVHRFFTGIQNPTMEQQMYSWYGFNQTLVLFFYIQSIYSFLSVVVNFARCPHLNLLMVRISDIAKSNLLYEWLNVKFILKMTLQL